MYIEPPFFTGSLDITPLAVWKSSRLDGEVRVIADRKKHLNSTCDVLWVERGGTSTDSLISAPGCSLSLFWLSHTTLLYSLYQCARLELVVKRKERKRVKGKREKTIRSMNNNRRPVCVLLERSHRTDAISNKNVPTERCRNIWLGPLQGCGRRSPGQSTRTRTDDSCGHNRNIREENPRRPDPHKNKNKSCRHI
jgi:hypothetical protein